jgi:hypothetical protein
MVSLLDPLASGLYSVGNLVTNVSPKISFFGIFISFFRNFKLIPSLCLKLEKITLRRFNSFLVTKTKEMH